MKESGDKEHSYEIQARRYQHSHRTRPDREDQQATEMKGYERPHSHPVELIFLGIAQWHHTSGVVG